MTIPDESVFDIIQNRYADILQSDTDDDEDGE
jgi:hypothetical protein